MDLAIAAAALLALIQPQEAPSPSIEHDLRILADDAMAGREAGTPGYDAAADHVATAFEAMALRPGAPDFRQPVGLRRRTLVDPGFTAVLTTPDGPLTIRNGEDFAIDAGRTPLERVDAPLVFVGWGISAPELGHDDYADLDVRGRIAVLLEGAPSGFPPALRAHYSWIDQKDAMAYAAGAVGVLTIKSPAREAVAPWERVRLNRPLPALSWVRPDGGGAPDRTGLTGTLGPDVAQALFGAAGLDLGAITTLADGGGAPEAQALGASLAMTRVSRHDAATSDNVVAILRGADPDLADEYVLVTAHLDHVGTGRPVEGDAIYNGAVDNAVGVAVMLDVARRLSADPPARSVIFLATTAEEKGLLGAEYFAANPVVPLGDVVAVINIDGMPAFYDFADIVALGAEHSGLGAISERAAALVGAVHGPDPVPERGNLALSDQYPFLRAGIPVLFPLPGRAPGREGEDAEAIWDAFMTRRYHQPSDDMDQPWRWDTLDRWSLYLTETVAGAANADVRPQWIEGDRVAAVFRRY